MLELPYRAVSTLQRFKCLHKLQVQFHTYILLFLPVPAVSALAWFNFVVEPLERFAHAVICLTPWLFRCDSNLLSQR